MSRTSIANGPAASSTQPEAARASHESGIRALSPAPSGMSLRPSACVEDAGDATGSRAGEARVAMLVVRRLVEAVEIAGVSREDALAAAGIPEEALAENDTGVPRHLVERMCELAIQPSGDPALGLHWSERLTIHTFGPVSHTLMHATSLRQGLGLLLQFQPLFCDQQVFALEEKGDLATLRLVDWKAHSRRVHRFSAEMCLASFMTMIRAHSPEGQVDRVCFSYEAPEYVAEYTRVFGSIVRFGQSFDGIVFERASLDRVNPNADDEVRTALADVLERRVVRATEDAPYAVRVRELLTQQMPARLNMEAAARKLGLAERSLRRRLAEECVSFRAIQHAVCASVAEQLLQDKRLTIQETAHAMGFSDSSTFHRAFKRWTGTTPRTFCGR